MAKKLEPVVSWEQLFNTSTRELQEFFSGKDSSPQLLMRARIASAVLSAFTRHEATMSARETTMVIVARHLAEDKEQFRDYLKASLPNLPLALTSGANS